MIILHTDYKAARAQLNSRLGAHLAEFAFLILVAVNCGAYVELHQYQMWTR